MYRSTFFRSISQLVELGFIDIAHLSGGMIQDASKYAFSERWRESGKKEFFKKSRPKDKRGSGFTKENWKKAAGKNRPIKKLRPLLLLHQLSRINPIQIFQYNSRYLRTTCLSY
jgi:hypothetical protein